MIKQIIIPILITVSLSSIAQTNNRWQIEKFDNRLGFIDSLGNEIYTDNFSMLGKEYNSGLVSFIKGNEYGFLDTMGQVAFKTEKYHGEFSEGLLKVEKEGRFHYLNTKGEIAIPLDSLELPVGKEIYRTFRFSNGLAMVIICDIGFMGSHDIADDVIVAEYINMYPDKWHYGFIDKDGKWKIEPTLSSATIFHDGISLAVKDSSSYFMNTKGDFISKIYDHTGEIWTEVGSDAFDYAEGFAIIYKNDSATYINQSGELITELKFQRADKFSDGMACVQLNEKWGFIDTSGQLTIEPKYYVRSNFSEGVAPVSLKVDEKGYSFNSYFIEGFIDKKGNIIIPFTPHIDYDGFKNGITKGRRFIYSDKKYTGKYELFYMNRNGDKIWSEIVKQ